LSQEGKMKSYAEYYDLCKENYKSLEQPENLLDLYSLGMIVNTPGKENRLLQFPENYSKVVSSLSKAIADKVEDPTEHYRDPSASGYDIAIQIKDIYDIPELEELAQMLLPQLEKTVFGSYIHCSAIHAYRNIQTDSPEVSSWLWHYDNNPKEAVKLLVYLTDVSEDTAPFELLTSPEGGAVKMSTSRTGPEHWGPPYIHNSRIPKDMMESFYSQGLKNKKITGPKGTALFFDNNIVHRANIPTKGYRDVVIYNIRPTMHKMKKYISKDTTGSWTHKSPIMDPELLTPTPKR
jgi:hypothetical protein